MRSEREHTLKARLRIRELLLLQQVQFEHSFWYIIKKYGLDLYWIAWIRGI